MSQLCWHRGFCRRYDPKSSCRLALRHRYSQTSLRDMWNQIPNNPGLAHVPSCFPKLVQVPTVILPIRCFRVAALTHSNAMLNQAGVMSRQFIASAKDVYWVTRFERGHRCPDVPKRFRPFCYQKSRSDRIHRFVFQLAFPIVSADPQDFSSV